MLLDMLSSDMYANFNVKLAHRIGLHTAIYVAELININRKAIMKEKLVDGKFFKVDRTYIEQRTTLTKTEQKELDSILVNLNVMSVHSTSKDIVYLDLNAFTGILLDDNSRVECNIKNIALRKKNTKKDVMVTGLKESICVPNVELRKAYDEWIDSVISREGWMSKTAIKEGQKMVDNYTKKDLDIALEILRIAATNGYRDVTWAIERYEKNLSNSGLMSQLNAPAYTAHSNIPTKEDIFFTEEEF